MSHRNSNGDSSGRPQQQKKKKPKGYASLLHAVDVRCIVLDRVRENGPERVSLRGRQLADPDAVKAVCDAVLELRVGVDEQASSSIDSNIFSRNFFVPQLKIETLNARIDFVN